MVASRPNTLDIAQALLYLASVHWGDGFVIPTKGLRRARSGNVVEGSPRHPPFTVHGKTISTTLIFANKQVVIVGGGIGGLAVAARLANLPETNVTLLEKQDSIGGRCGSWTDSAGFRHERGPSLLLLPHIYEELFQDVVGPSASAKDFGLEYRRCVPAYRAIFDDGDFVDIGYPSDHPEYENMLDKLESIEPGGSSRWKRYMEACDAYLNCGLPNFIEEKLDLKSFPNFILQATRDFGKAWPLKPHSNVLDGIFESAKMKALASFQDLYVGLEPYQNKEALAGGVLTSTAPAVFGLLSAIELHPSNSKSGVFAPVGGFDSVTKSIEALARSRGVNILCNTTVTKVDTSGATTSKGSLFPADVLIINADLPYAEACLLGNNDNKERFDWEDKYRFSSGVVAFHWSVRKKLDMLSTHTVFLATHEDDARKSWETVRANAKFRQPFNFYVHCPGKSDPTACPDDCETVMVLVPCQTLVRDESLSKLPREAAIKTYGAQFDESVIDEIRNAVIDRMHCVATDLEDAIINETVDSPSTYAAAYNLGAGTPFGLSHGLGQLSFARRSQSDNMSKVLFCGASARPGNGVPLVLVGAKLTAKAARTNLCQSERYQDEN